jgi:hypothetical protein
MHVRLTCSLVLVVTSCAMIGVACSPEVRDFGGAGGGDGPGVSASASSGGGASASASSGGGVSSSSGPGSGVSVSSSVSTGTGVVCPPGEQECGGVCVDVSRDPANCGDCGVDCGGGSCVDGGCQPVRAPVALATGQRGPQDLAVNATHVYWVNKSGGEVNAVPIDGGTIRTLATGQVNVENVALDGTSVYWTTIFVPRSTIKKAPLGGGPETLLFEGIRAVNDLAVVSGDVFWAEYASGSGSVSMIPVSTTQPTVIVDGAMNPRGIEVKEASRTTFSVFWTNHYGGDSSVQRQVVPSMVELSPLAAGQQFPYAIAVDAANVYWSTLDDRALWSVRRDGGLVTMLASGHRANDIAVDESRLYWVDSVAGTVTAMPLSGGAPVTLAGGQLSPSAIAVDATSVYWTNGDFTHGAVMRMAK